MEDKVHEAAVTKSDGGWATQQSRSAFSVSAQL